MSLKINNDIYSLFTIYLITTYFLYGSIKAVIYLPSKYDDIALTGLVT